MSLQLSPAMSIPSQASTPGASDNGIATAISYSARGGSKTFSANVEQVASEYEASVPNLFGADTTASTLGQAEINLDNLISFFA